MKQESNTQLDIKKYLIENYIEKRKTYRQLCEEIGISKRMLQLLLLKYDIPARKVGKRHKKNTNS